jgi:hypothetical protein
MALVSVTRLRVRSLWRLPVFGWHAFQSTRRIQASEGFLSGYFANEPRRVFWTVTAWTDAASMKAFRNGGAHLAAMKGLPGFCDEASYFHFEQEGAELPAIEEAHRRMREEGKVTKVRAPSPEHAQGRTCSERVPKVVQKIGPRAR